MDLTNFIEEKLNLYAKRMAEGGAKADEIAFGELTFYVALRRVQQGKGTMQDIGMMDAINDTMQQLGLIESNVLFYKKLS
jgi:hypothetical protein